MIRTRIYLVVCGFLLSGVWLLAGCQKPGTASRPASAQNAKNKHEHDHPETGPHGGALIEWGDDEYHAEFTVDHATQTATVYVLDASAKSAPKLDASKISKVMLTLTQVSPPLTLELKPEPAKSNAQGIAFAIKHEQFAKEADFQGNVSATIDGQAFTGEFKEHDHDHPDKGRGALDHPGGIHVAFAQGRFYAEALLFKGGTLHLFLFGKSLTAVVQADEQTIPAYIRRIGEKEFTSFDLKSEPLPGDGQGFTSRFIGQIPRDLVSQELEVTIPALKLYGERYHLAFQTVQMPHEPENHGDASIARDNAQDSDEERKLFLTPGGVYTLADIKANGRMTGGEKFKGFQAGHDVKPKAGDKICPVTLTKANEKCTWIIGGQVYEFCCPPCVEEFVKLAKEEPSTVKPPASYVKK
jgi:hypothetical protein